MLGRELVKILKEVKDFTSLKDSGREMLEELEKEIIMYYLDNDINEVVFYENIAYGNGKVKHTIYKDNIVPEHHILKDIFNELEYRIWHDSYYVIRVYY